MRRCTHLIFAAFLLRMGLYTALPAAPTPWLVLPAEVLHGVTFALAWGGGCAHCAELAPPGLEATTQGLFQGAPALSGCCCSGGALAAPLLNPAPPSPPPPCAATAGLYFGVGVGVGALVGGRVFHSLGAQAVYFVACGVLAAGWAATSAAAAVAAAAGACPARYRYLQVELSAAEEHSIA